MRLKCGIAAAGTVFAVAAATTAGPEDKFLSDLPAALESAAAGELVPVTIMLAAYIGAYNMIRSIFFNPGAAAK